MINILEQNVPTTASIGSFGEEGTSTTRTDNPYSEKEIWFFTLFNWQRVSDYLDTNEFLQTTSVLSPDRLSILERSLFGWSSLINGLESDNSISHLISSPVIRSLADKITPRKIGLIH